MRAAFFVATLAVAAAVVPATVALGTLATAASALLEATPFVAGGTALAAIVRRPHLAALLGCGCGRGPAARSIPAALATWLVFGPSVAIARFVAALAIARVLERGVRSRTGAAHSHLSVLAELTALLPAAAIAGVVAQLPAYADVRHFSPLVQMASGALLGFAAAPCGLGAVAVGGALHRSAPLAAYSFLCVAGLADLRSIAVRAVHKPGHDVVAYALLAAALGIVGLRKGAALVHPAIAAALLGCAIAAIATAIAHRRHRSAGTRLAPALMLAGALVSAPPPAYHATETTLADAFAGEALTFSGTLVRSRDTAALVRYAITCCRADATPVVLRLARVPQFRPGTWLRADGTIALEGGEQRLEARRIEPISPPADPFTYR
jgi:hypothetical protein